MVRVPRIDNCLGFLAACDGVFLFLGSGPNSGLAFVILDSGRIAIIDGVFLHHDRPIATTPFAFLMLGLFAGGAIELPGLFIAIDPSSVLPCKGQDLRLFAARIGGQLFLRTGRDTVGVGIVLDTDDISARIFGFFLEGFGPIVV